MAIKKTTTSSLFKKIKEMKEAQKMKSYSMYSQQRFDSTKRIRLDTENRIRYVNLKVKTNVKKNGEEIRFVESKCKDPYSISIFIAGGKQIDEKVAKINSKLIRENSKFI